MVTVLLILALVAFVLTILSIVRPAWTPLWIAVLILSLIELLREIPLGR